MSVNVFLLLKLYFFCYELYTSTLCTTTECCRGFEDIKDEISSSHKAFDIFGLIFHWIYYFWVENLSNLCKLIVCGSQTLRSTQQTQVSKTEAYPILYSQSRIQRMIIQYTMVSNPLLQNIRRLLDPLNAQCETCAILKDFRVSAKRWSAPNEFRYRKIEQLIPDTNCCLTTAKNCDLNLHISNLIFRHDQKQKFCMTKVCISQTLWFPLFLFFFLGGGGGGLELLH